MAERTVIYLSHPCPTHHPCPVPSIVQQHAVKGHYLKVAWLGIVVSDRVWAQAEGEVVEQFLFSAISRSYKDLALIDILSNEGRSGLAFGVRSMRTAPRRELNRWVGQRPGAQPMREEGMVADSVNKAVRSEIDRSRTLDPAIVVPAFRERFVPPMSFGPPRIAFRERPIGRLCLCSKCEEEKAEGSCCSHRAGCACKTA